MKRNAVLVPSVLAAATLTWGCIPEDQRTETVDAQAAWQAREAWPPEVVAHVDSGNTAFRDEDLEEALRHYTTAAEGMPDNAAAWFGVNMAQLALGNQAAADSALDMARKAAPGASLIHAIEPDSTESPDEVPR
ncbi:MAG: hypothetical protein ACC667_10625 [Longimicrobiales bacterium]